MRTRDHLLILCLAAVLTWLLFMGLSSRAPKTEASIRHLNAYAERQSELRSDILSARAGMLRSYDPLGANLNAMQRRAEGLQRSAPDNEDRAFVQALARSLERQERLIESFKTHNALAQNSLTYVSRFSAKLTGRPGGPRLRAASDAAWGAMMRLTLDTSPPAVEEARLRLDTFARLCKVNPCTPRAAGLLAHGRLLSSELPAIDRIVGALLHPSHRTAVARLAARLEEQQRLAEGRTVRFRVLLYVASLLLLYLLGRWGMQLRIKTDTLRRQAAVEHAVASLSAALIGTTSETLPRAISIGISQLCRSLSAVKSLYHSERTGDIWCTGDIDSGADSEAARAIIRRAQGSVAADAKLRCVMLGPGELAPGLRESIAPAASCLCLFVPGGARTELLLFALGSTNSPVSPSLFPVLETAFDTIAIAIDHAFAELERLKLEQQMRHARRMQTVGTFTSGVAHNFNNLLGAIVGNAEMAHMQLLGHGKSTEPAERILLAAERGRSLVENLLAYGRRPEHRLRRVRLDRLVTEAVGLVSAAMPDMRFSLKLDAAARVLIDPIQMQQVVMNLCTNAAQASEGGAEIIVATDRAALRERRSHAHGALEAGSYLRVSVRDRGKGIGPAVLARIFEPFYSTRPSGTGLGLATAQEIVRASGGDILIASRSGEGTDAQIWLPWTPHQEAVRPGRAPPESLRGNGETILYLAGSERSRLSGEELLAALGYEPVGFTSLSLLGEACRATPGRFDAFLAEPIDLGGRALPVDDLPAIRLVASSATGAFCGFGEMLGQPSAIIRYPLDPVELLAVLGRFLNAHKDGRDAAKLAASDAN
jgi:signal transduction histidine kinase